DTAEGIERRLDDFVGVLGLGDRERRGDRLAPELLDLGDQATSRSRIGAGALQARPDVADHDTRALTRERQPNPASRTPTAAGNDGDLVGDDACCHSECPLRTKTVSSE